MLMTSCLIVSEIIFKINKYPSLNILTTLNMSSKNLIKDFSLSLSCLSFLSFFIFLSYSIYLISLIIFAFLSFFLYVQSFCSFLFMNYFINLSLSIFLFHSLSLLSPFHLSSLPIFFLFHILFPLLLFLSLFLSLHCSLSLLISFFLSAIILTVFKRP